MANNKKNKSVITMIAVQKKLQIPMQAKYRKKLAALAARIKYLQNLLAKDVKQKKLSEAEKADIQAQITKLSNLHTKIAQQATKPIREKLSVSNVIKKALKSISQPAVAQTNKR